MITLVIEEANVDLVTRIEKTLNEIVDTLPEKVRTVFLEEIRVSTLSDQSV